MQSGGLKLTDALLGEHGIFHALFDLVEEMAGRDEPVVQIRAATTVLAAMVDRHATLEEDLLFHALEPRLGRDAGPLAVMWAEHEEMAKRLTEIESADGLGRAVDLIETALNLARSHFQKEEQVLFPLAERLLDRDTLIDLGRAWAERRGVAVGWPG